jgi:hypothetical protein
MKSDGFVLILCLCFIAMVSSMALSALVIALLSQNIGVAGQQQLLQLKFAKSLHLQQDVVTSESMGNVVLCPAELAVWTEPATRCRWISQSSQHESFTPWSSLILASEMTLPKEGL